MIAMQSHSALLARARYYSARVGDRLERAGLPLRRRSLLFFGRHPAAAGLASVAESLDARVEVITPTRLRSLEWSANPTVREEAADFRGPGTQVPIAAVNGNSLLGYCWLEAGTVDLRFFDVEAPIPSGTVYLSRVWVAPSARGSGLGRSLLLAASSIAVDLGHRELVSACVPANLRMRHLFSQLGWRALGRIDYLRAGPALLFERHRPGTPPVRVRSLERARRLVFAD